MIAEPDPSEHPGWHKEWLHLAVDELYNYNISVEERDRLRILQQTTAYAEKGVYDYIYGLEHCYAKETPFIGMLEDDILLADGWLVRTLQSLARLPTPVDEESSWLFLRLFNQERSTGWATRSVGGNNEAVIIVSIGLIISTFTYLVHRKWQRARTNIDIETIVVVVLLLNPALVILFFQCGKASMLPPSPGVVREPFGCCSQAMIFPRSVVPSIVMFLQKEKQGQIDTLLDDLAQEANLSRYALYPVQAQHIGMLRLT